MFKLRAEDLGLPIEVLIGMRILTEEGFGETLGKLYNRGLNRDKVFRSTAKSSPCEHQSKNA
jgi:hypothetical protein